MIRNIFPEQDQLDELDLPQNDISKEYDWDFNKNEFVLKNGRPQIVTEGKAIRVWIYKTLMTERFNHLAYSQDFGQEYD